MVSCFILLVFWMVGKINRTVDIIVNMKIVEVLGERSANNSYILGPILTSFNWY